MQIITSLTKRPPSYLTLGGGRNISLTNQGGRGHGKQPTGRHGPRPAPWFRAVIGSDGRPSRPTLTVCGIATTFLPGLSGIFNRAFCVPMQATWRRPRIWWPGRWPRVLQNAVGRQSKPHRWLSLAAILICVSILSTLSPPMLHSRVH
ncbi:hypothetical protein CTAM01_08394 [Colletotrichum tamarilloi]|uniref:Uncharacterized protein n=1 Tax=Colletotrichum tamarilloi TaxID=1209934 RepID=A0ABQ9R660_9PEZI|nr:uncharacterized protein CTAM01_08394 [Colletotrichum tamarilloi]KAK1496207.1 hypothetical protein CTAM01_08394 [Colletotrichum tamarilloi]